MDQPGRTDGAALIEFSLIFPVFLLLVFGILYFGIYLFTQQAVKNAAQQGANAAVAVDVDSAGNGLSSLVLTRVDTQVSSSLPFLPGQIGELKVSTTAAGGQCGTTAGPGLVCLAGPDNDGGYTVGVRLTPSFSNLWPGFPDLLAFLTGGDAESAVIEARARVRLTSGSQGGG